MPKHYDMLFIPINFGIFLFLNKNKKFHIYAISTIEEGIEVLTGVPAGKKDSNGKFPAGSVNYLAYEKLKKYAEFSKKS